FLLDALDDKTPTKVVVEHAGWFGVMTHAAEMRTNPVNPGEEAAYKARARKPRRNEPADYAKSYTVKVGDVCFVAIGQMVGRGYQAVRYQPTANIRLNCPAHDPKLCAEVRGVWRSKDPRANLFDSLLADYSTRGMFNEKSLEESLDGLASASAFQCGA